jgi:Zn-dependent peptidase ImmA (M78 family)
MLLKELGLTGPPVDSVKVLRKLGAYVGYHLNPDYAFSFVKNGRFLVSLDICNSPGRMNWSGAHELAHWVLKHFEIYEVDTLLEDRLTEAERRILDREADIFARELLLPKAWVRAAVGSGVTFEMIDRLAEKFTVSWEAMMIRLDELELFPRGELVPF